MNDAIHEHPLAGMFNRLSPEQVLGAVEVGGRRCTGRFIVLNSYENRVYQLELEDESWVVGKFYRPGRWSTETILDEHSFLAELVAEEIPVAAPLDLGDGTLGEVDGILYSLFPRIGGRNPEELDDEQTRMVGRLIARIHNVGARRDAPHRLRLSTETYGRKNLRFLVETGALPPEAKDNYLATCEALFDRIEPLLAEVPVHRIHGDCHPGNLIRTRDGFTFLDFDDMLVGPAVQDVWMLVPSYDDFGRRQREVLIEAYEGIRRFETRWLSLVEPLRALRFVHYSTWVARRWDDPVFKRTFSHFGDLRYWQQEIQDLREQIARLDPY
ncbi:MAG TPA: serine/threonine protein kinase [Polyangia bacterium]|nr:serine/threonine protein kinase [Polyangia bacterium]